MGYTSSPLLLISLTAASSNQSYLIAVLGNLCERSNPLSEAHKRKGFFST